MEAIAYIRWSSEKQTKGSSLGRQRAAIEEYCDGEGWPVAEWHQDEGVSAFFGHNLATGKLGQLLERFEREGGTGVALVVEQIDRISRLNAFDVTLLIGRFVETGATVVLADQHMMIDKVTIRNQQAQLGHIVEAARKANDEIEQKAKRIRAAWQFMREGAVVTAREAGVVSEVQCRGGYPAYWKISVTPKRGRKDMVYALTSWSERGMLAVGDNIENGEELGAAKRKMHTSSTCPAWLLIDDERISFTPVPEKVAVLRRLFDLYIAGHGKRGIAKILNSEGVEPFRAGRGWHASSIHKLIETRSVIGEYRHHVGRRPTGAVESSYFPQVISNELFQAANDANHRRLMRSHTQGQKFSNLFSGLCFCFECGSPLIPTHKSRTKDGRPAGYLKCDAYMRGTKGCTSVRALPYLKFETAVLDVLLNVAMDDEHFAQTDEVGVISQQVAEKRRELQEIGGRIENIVNVIDSTDFISDARFLARLRAIQEDELRLAREVEMLQEQMRVAAGKVSPSEHIKRVSDMRGDLYCEDSARKEQAQARIKRALSQLIECVYIESHLAKTCVILREGLRHIVIDFKGLVLHDGHANRVSVPYQSDGPRARSDVGKDYLRRLDQDASEQIRRGEEQELMKWVAGHTA